MKRKIIIDTDPGYDDAIALILAIKCEQFDICAVTTVCGNSTVENTTKNAQFILSLFEERNIPIYSGSTKPLNRPLIQAKVHGTSGLDGIVNDKKAELSGDAVDKIISIVKNNPNKITIVTLGPLTNIARAIQKDPETILLVKEIVSMAGAINVPGNTNNLAEFNMFVDPDAANIVFSFKVKKTIIPLDACNQVFLTLSDCKKVKNIRLQKLLIQMLVPYLRNLNMNDGIKKAIMYDPLTIYYLLNSNASKIYKKTISVDISSKSSRGRLLSNKNTDSLSQNVTTIVKSVGKTFRKDLITYLNN